MSEPTDASTFDEESPLTSVLTVLDRVRKRAIWVLVTLLASTMVCWAFASRLYELLVQPLTQELQARGADTRLVFTNLTDPFVLYFTVALLGGLAISCPVLMGQLWLAIAPRMRHRRVLSLSAFVLCAALLFVGGLTFSQLILMPYAVGYLLDIGSEFEHAITIRDYLRFSVRLLLAMGVAAQLPLLSFAGARTGLLTARTMMRWFPHAVLVIFILAAWVTRPTA